MSISVQSSCIDISYSIYGVLLYCLSYATCRNMPRCIVKCKWVQLKVEIIKRLTASVTLCVLAIIFSLFLSYLHMHDKNKYNICLH